MPESTYGQEINGQLMWGRWDWEKLVEGQIIGFFGFIFNHKVSTAPEFEVEGPNYALQTPTPNTFCMAAQYVLLYMSICSLWAEISACNRSASPRLYCISLTSSKAMWASSLEIKNTRTHFLILDISQDKYKKLVKI